MMNVVLDYTAREALQITFDGFCRASFEKPSYQCLLAEACRVVLDEKCLVSRLVVNIERES